jgi:hypothetical protein
VILRKARGLRSFTFTSCKCDYSDTVSMVGLDAGGLGARDQHRTPHPPPWVNQRILRSRMVWALEETKKDTGTLGMGEFRIGLIILFSVLEASEETFFHFSSSREPSLGPDIHYPCFCSPTKFEPLIIQTPIQSAQIKESNSSRCSNINVPLNNSLTIGMILGSPGSLSTRAISECVITSRRLITR